MHLETQKQKQTFLTLCIFLLCTLGYFVWRSSTHIVWNDTAGIATIVLDNGKWPKSINLFALIHYFFRDVTMSGYRPLTGISASYGFYALRVGGLTQSVFLWMVSIIQGLTAVVFYRLAYRFTCSTLLALGALFLWVCSAPFQTSAWVYAASIQSVVPLLMSLGILIYLNLIAKEGNRTLLMIALGAIYFFGPWYREFIGLLPLILLTYELCRTRRINTIVILSLLGFLHALFPTALIKLFFYHGLPLTPVYQYGYLSLMVSQPILMKLNPFQIFVTLNWTVPLHMLFLLPPTFLAILLIMLYRSDTTQRYQVKPQKAWLYLRITHTIIAGILLLLAVITDWYYIPKGLFWFWVTLAIPLYALRSNPMLALWFTLTYIPFLRVFQEEVHLLYCLAPASMIMMLAAREAWNVLSKRTLPRRIAKPVFAALLCVLFLDQGLTAYGSYRITHALNANTQDLVQWFKRNIPKNSIIITNASHGYDIQYFSDNYFNFHFTIPWNSPFWRVINSKKLLIALLKKNNNQYPIYVLDVNYPMTPSLMKFDNYYITKKILYTQPIGRIKTLSIKYPYADPLKMFAARPYISFLGPPDLFKDFYYGHALDHTPFMNEVFAVYNLYRVTDKKRSGLSLSGKPSLRKRYKDYSIYRWGKHTIAIPSGLEPPTQETLARKNYTYPSWFSADSYPTLKREIGK